MSRETVPMPFDWKPELAPLPSVPQRPGVDAPWSRAVTRRLERVQP